MKSGKPWYIRYKISLIIVATTTLLSVVFVGYLVYSSQQADLAHQKTQAQAEEKFQATMKAIKEKKTRELAAEAKARKKIANQATKSQPSTTSNSSSPACNTSTSHNNPNSIDVVVNKKNCLVPISYAPSDLVTVAGATLRQEAATQFGQLVSAASSAGLPIGSSSSYRSYSTQVSTYNYWVASTGSVAETDKVSARAGYSEHQTGLAVDVAVGGCNLQCFGTTKAYGWMKSNAHKYGFIERYQSGMTHITGYDPEPWHYRYVGITTASQIHASGVKTLEQHFGFPAASGY